MALPGGYDPLLGVTSPYPITQQPNESRIKASAQAEEGVFLENLAQQLHRTDSPYAAAGGTQADLLNLLGNVPADKLREIDSVSREFESVLLFTMFKQMWDTVPESTMFGNGMASEIYREMWLEELSGEISTSGSGIGVADNFKWEMIQRELNSVSPDSEIELVS